MLGAIAQLRPFHRVRDMSICRVSLYAVKFQLACRTALASPC